MRTGNDAQYLKKEPDTDRNYLSPFLACPGVGKFSISYPSHCTIITNLSPSVSTSLFHDSYLFYLFYYSDFRNPYANLRYAKTSEVTVGQMWFALIMFWHSSTLVHHIVLYWIDLRPCILFLYLWIHHEGTSTTSGVVIII